MFVAEPTEADTLTDFLQLQKGMGFHAQVGHRWENSSALGLALH